MTLHYMQFWTQKWGWSA